MNAAELENRLRDARTQKAECHRRVLAIEEEIADLFGEELEQEMAALARAEATCNALEAELEQARDRAA